MSDTPATTVVPCKNCGGNLEFHPGAGAMKCPFCGTENAMPVVQPPAVYEELDYRAALTELASAGETVQVQNLTCPGCAAEITLEPNVTTGKCTFCGTEVVAPGGGETALKPQYLLPFAITRDESRKKFGEWIRTRRFAPQELKKRTQSAEPLRGVYLPHWTFDASTTTNYRGERGEYYTETVQVRNSEGKMEERQVTKTRWYPAWGTVRRAFDDILIPASESLPAKLLNRIRTWDLKKLLRYAEQYLAGFKAESYTVGLEAGFDGAKAAMKPEIESDIRRDIGGDTQRISRMETNYADVTFKYILLPVWATKYLFKKKYFTVVINGATGEVQGERPVSVWKILILILVLAAIGVGVYFLVTKFGG